MFYSFPFIVLPVCYQAAATRGSCLQRQPKIVCGVRHRLKLLLLLEGLGFTVYGLHEEEAEQRCLRPFSLLPCVSGAEKGDSDNYALISALIQIRLLFSAAAQQCKKQLSLRKSKTETEHLGTKQRRSICKQ